MRPRWKNWYLTIFYLLSGGATLLLMIMFMGWYVNAPAWFVYKVRLLILPHILFCLGLYVTTEAFEFIWKRVCK